MENFEIIFFFFDSVGQNEIQQRKNSKSKTDNSVSTLKKNSVVFHFAQH
jgi:hypothetical protein